MGNNNEIYSCVDCIWRDQCPSNELCEFFDRGQYDEELSEEEIELQLEINRSEYAQAYQEYIQEFSDGNKE